MTERTLTPSGKSPYNEVTFLGIDWGGKDYNVARCPRCRTHHRFRKRTPLRCRHCDLKFLYTANAADSKD